MSDGIRNLDQIVASNIERLARDLFAMTRVGVFTKEEADFWITENAGTLGHQLKGYWQRLEANSTNG